MVQLTLMACFVIPITAHSEDWNQWGGPGRNFRVGRELFGDSTDLSRIRRRWEHSIGSGHSGISVREGVAFTCFTIDRQEHVTAFSLEDGNQVWKRVFEVPTSGFMDLEFGLGPHATPLVTDDRLICCGLTGRLSALDVGSGATIWERQLWANGRNTELERGCAASPIAFQDSVIVPVGGPGQSIQCFALNDGAIRWQKHDFACAYSSPVIDQLGGRLQLVQLMDQNLVGLDPSNGELLWCYSVPTEDYVNCASPVVGPNNTIFINTSDGLRGLQLLDVGQGFEVREMWSSRITIRQTANFVLQDGVLYGAREGGIFVAVDARTGRTLWQSRELRDCTVILAGDYVVAVQERGELAIAKVSPEAIDVRYRLQALSPRCWIGPVISHGLLLVRDSKQLIAFELP